MMGGQCAKDIDKARRRIKRALSISGQGFYLDVATKDVIAHLEDRMSQGETLIRIGSIGDLEDGVTLEIRVSGDDVLRAGDNLI
jgi:hypothetical protein